MPASAYVTVHVDLGRVRQNIADVRARVGRAEIHAVVKADAYGLGARKVAAAVADVVDGFVVFQAAEAVEAKLPDLGKPILALRPDDLVETAALGVRPAVWDAQTAEELRAWDPVVCVDTGMQRFACPPEQLERVIEAGQVREAFTHATSVEQVRRLVELVGGSRAGGRLRLHAAGTSLLHEPAAHLDLVRPGLALYRGAVSVRTQFIEQRDSRGPVGYSGFTARQHGVILAGYSHGLRPGPCLVGGRRRRIAEVGMQSAFVALEQGDEAADVTLLGHADAGNGEVVTEEEIAAAWGSTPHEVLISLARMGRHRYSGGE